MGLFILCMTNRDYMNNSFLVVKPLKDHDGLLDEYIQLLKVLRNKGVILIEFSPVDNIESSKYLCTKNWISFHGNGAVAVYPLSSLERQRERNDSIFDVLEENGFVVNDVVDFTEAEEEGVFLEGLGSVVIDTVNDVAYASISKKCDEELFIEFCEDLEYTPIVFSSEYQDGRIVEDTSSMLSISENFAIIASSLIKDKKERKLVTLQLKKSGREVIYINESQVSNHVAEIKQIRNESGDSFLILSKLMFDNLNKEQLEKLESYGELLVVDYNTTEKFGNHSIGYSLNELYS